MIYKDLHEKETTNYVKGFNMEKRELDLTEYLQKIPQYPLQNFKILFILMSHKFNTRLFEKIYNKDDYFIIHLDLKETNSKEYERFQNVFVYSFYNVSWGGFSQVRLQLQSMKIGMELFKDFQYVINLSMDDFPLQSINSLKKELSNRAQYFNTFEINYVESGYAGNSLFRDAYQDCNGTITPLFWFKYPPKIEIFSGSSWYILSKSFINYILKDQNIVPKFKYFMRHLLFCDEMFFQTLLHHSNYTFINDNLRFISWEFYSKECIGNICGRRPSVMTKRQIYPLLVNKDIFFARKVGNDKSIVEELEKERKYEKEGIFNLIQEGKCLKSLNFNVTFEECNHDISQDWIIGPCTKKMTWDNGIPLNTKDIHCWIQSVENMRCLEWNGNYPNEVVYLGKCSNFLIQMDQSKIKVSSIFQPSLYLSKENNLLILKPYHEQIFSLRKK